MDASEHQDSNNREDDEDDDGRHDDDGQCGHAVAGQLISCEGRETTDFSSDWQAIFF